MGWLQDEGNSRIWGGGPIWALILTPVPSPRTSTRITSELWNFLKKGKDFWVLQGLYE
jgi:hypothetical protein